MWFISLKYQNYHVLPSIGFPFNLIWWESDVCKEATFSFDIFDVWIWADPVDDDWDAGNIVMLLKVAGATIEETEGTVVFDANVVDPIVEMLESRGDWYEIGLPDEHKVIAVWLLWFSPLSFDSFPPLLKSKVSP